MKEELLSILKKYLEIFPEEERQAKFLNYLNETSNNDLIDWNNFDGHIVASGFVYSTTDKKFLVLYHKDMKMYVYPGGHVDSNDSNVFEAAKREVREETGLKNFKNVKVADTDLVPIDIDTQLIAYNERLDLPEHFHFDFRYLFTVDKIYDIKQDEDELGDYKWIDISELRSNKNYGEIATKMEKIIK